MQYAVGTALVITLENNDVYFGYLEAEGDDFVVLRSARNCLYWHEGLHGYMGLAIAGPNQDCFVGPAATRVKFKGVKTMVECSDIAAKAWELEPWGRGDKTIRSSPEAPSLAAN